MANEILSANLKNKKLGNYVSSASAGAPDAPTIGTATGASGTFTVPYTNNANNGSAILDNRATLSSGESLTGTQNPFVFTGLANGISRTATVTARNANGSSDPSASSNAVVFALVPGAPTIGTATAGNGSITVPFTAPASNGGSAITSYIVTLSTGETASGSSSPITITGLSAVARTATVKAVNDVGQSAASASSNSVTPSVAATVPDAPTIGVATAGNATVSVTFTAPSNNGGSAIINYTATLSTGATASGTGSPIVFSGVANNTPVTVTVKANNGVGASAASAASNSVTPSASATAPSAPTIGTATASYNDTQGNILSVPFTANSDGGSAITGYTVTLSTGETKTGSSSPIVFINTLSNDVARTARVTATNAIGTSAQSAASNSVTPVSIVRGVAVENRTPNGKEGRSKTGLVGRRASIVGSGAIKDFAAMVHGWIEASSAGYVPLDNAFTINELSASVAGGTPVIMTWSGVPSITVNPGDTEIISDYKTPAQLLGGGATEIPVGTKVFWKFRITLPTTSGVMWYTAGVVADISGSQYGFYDPAATTLTNTSATDGVWTVTGTALDTRTNGFIPQMLGHFVTGDPKTAFTLGDSIQQNIGDATAHETGRGWAQYLMTDSGALTNPYACMNCAVSGDTTSHFLANTKLLDLAKYSRIGIESLGTNDLGQSGAGVPSSIRANSATLWGLMKSKSVGGAMPILRTFIQPQSSAANPVKTINSAPNTNWGVDEKSKQLNDLYAADLASNNIQWFVDPVSVRQSSNNTQVEYYLWKYTSTGPGTSMTVDGTHPATAGVILWAEDIRPTWNTIS